MAESVKENEINKRLHCFVYFSKVFRFRNDADQQSNIFISKQISLYVVIEI